MESGEVRNADDVLIQFQYQYQYQCATLLNDGNKVLGITKGSKINPHFQQFTRLLC